MIDEACRSIAKELSTIPGLKIFPDEHTIQSMAPGQGTLVLHQVHTQTTMGSRGNQTVTFILQVMLRSVVSGSSRKSQKKSAALLSMNPQTGILGKLKTMRNTNTFQPRCDMLEAQYLKGDADIALTLLMGEITAQIPYSGG